MNTPLTTVTYLSSSNQDVSIFYDLISHWFSTASFLISIGVWAILGFVLSRKAKAYGMNPAVHFLLCFFLHVIGIAISVVLIENRKKEIARFNRGATNPFFAQQYGQDQNYQNYQQQYGQNNQYGGYGYGQQQYGQPYNAHMTSCPSCGHTITEGNFCDVCGTRVR